MAKSWPDYMGTYKALVLEWGVTATKTKGLPQFVIRVLLMEYYDQKEQQWYDVSENNWVMNAYLCLYGRENSEEDGEIVPTLNHQQVCKVFEWDGCGFEYLNTPGRFDSKTIQVRVEENTGENAKAPVQINWVDAEDADPNSGLQKLDPAQVKELENKFSYLWKGKKAAPAVSAKKTALPVTAKKPPAEPVKVEKEPPAAEPEPPIEDAATRKKKILEKAKKLMKKTDPSEPPAAGKKKAPPQREEPPDDNGETGIPADYNKRSAWGEIIELRDKECTDDQQNASWTTAIAGIAPDGDEDKLDATGWWAVKEQVLAEIGQF